MRLVLAAVHTYFALLVLLLKKLGGLPRLVFGGFRLRYLPLLMIYFAYGAQGVSGIAETFWVKDHLQLPAAALMAVAFWANIPWTMKIVAGQFADSVRIFGSQRKVYVYIGAGVQVVSVSILVRLTGGLGWFVDLGMVRGILEALPALTQGQLYLLAAVLGAAGFMLQDVIADTMTTEVVDRTDPTTGAPRSEKDINKELGQVQWLGRLFIMSAGILTSGLVAGWLARTYSPETVFTIKYAIPLISLIGITFVRLNAVPRTPINWRILGGGLAFGAFVVGVGLYLSNAVNALCSAFFGALEYILRQTFRFVGYAWVVASAQSKGDVDKIVERLGGVRSPIHDFLLSVQHIAQDFLSASSQEIVLVVSLGVLIYLIRQVGMSKALALAATVLFIFRATPGTGPGTEWWMIDVLKFDKEFFGVLRQMTTILGIVGLVVFRKTITERPLRFTLAWLTIIGSIVSLPTIGMYYGLHDMLGISARAVAFFDTAIAAPLGQLSMIPMLIIIARSCPMGQAATQFALMASLMNVALSASDLGTRYLNRIYVVQQQQVNAMGIVTQAADYSQLGHIMLISWVIGLVVPLIAILLFLGKKTEEEHISV